MNGVVDVWVVRTTKHHCYLPNYLCSNRYMPMLSE